MRNCIASSPLPVGGGRLTHAPQLWPWGGRPEPGGIISIIQIMIRKSFGNHYSNNDSQIIWKSLFGPGPGWGGRLEPGGRWGVIIIIQIMDPKSFGHYYSNNDSQIIWKSLFGPDPGGGDKSAGFR